MRTHKPGWIHTLKWAHRSEPPNGLPRVLGTWTDRNPTTEDYLAVYPDYKLGCGFASCIEFPQPKPRRKLTPEQNAIRKERAKKTLKARRLKAKLPLLADQIIKEEGLDWRGTGVPELPRKVTNRRVIRKPMKPRQHVVDVDPDQLPLL